MHTDYQCPQCRSRLDISDEAIHCASCARSYPLARGVPNFATRSYYWNHLPPEQMSELLERAQSEGYRQAIESIFGTHADTYLVGYILDESRADFATILPLTDSSDILDLGCGWGDIACTLATRAHSVTAVDTNPHTLQFIRIRAEQQGLHNVRPVMTDPLDDARLPFPDNSFDIVTLNGVLEYVGAATEQGSPRDIQRRCLSELRRVLKPGGVLYVGIENRYAYLYFMGSLDHNGMRFTSLLPRPLAQLATRIVKRHGYRTYTYSYQGYRSLLASAGFSAPEFHLAVPTYREPRFIIPANDERALRYFVQRHASHIKRPGRRRFIEWAFRTLPSRLLCLLVRQIAYSYLIVAEAAK